MQSERSIKQQAGHGIDILIGASKMATARGDYEQAERLLKTSLYRLQQQSQTTAEKMQVVAQGLVELYELQGRAEEASLLQEQLDRDVAEEKKLKGLILEAKFDKDTNHRDST